MTPENSPHIHNQADVSKDPINTSYDNAKVEYSSADLPPYAYVPNGGIPPHH